MGHQAMIPLFILEEPSACLPIFRYAGLIFDIYPFSFGLKPRNIYRAQNSRSRKVRPLIFQSKPEDPTDLAFDFCIISERLHDSQNWKVPSKSRQKLYSGGAFVTSTTPFTSIVAPSSLAFTPASAKYSTRTRQSPNGSRGIHIQG